MKKKIAVILSLAVAALLGAVSLYSPAGAAPIKVELGTKRALCTKIGTGELRDLWLTPDGRCQPGYNFTDVKALGIGGGAVGPKGDKGDKGDPGTGGIWFRKTTVALTAASPASQTVVITGVPAKSSLSIETSVPLTNASSAPGLAKISVIPLPVAAGSTERSFRVEVDSLNESFSLTIQVIGTVA